MACMPRNGGADAHVRTSQTRRRGGFWGLASWFSSCTVSILLPLRSSMLFNATFMHAQLWISAWISAWIRMYVEHWLGHHMYAAHVVRASGSATTVANGARGLDDEMGLLLFRVNTCHHGSGRVCKRRLGSARTC